MDRFSKYMVGVCICGSVAIVCMGFGTISYWILNPEHFSESFYARRSARVDSLNKSGNVKPERGTGGTTGSDTKSKDSSQADETDSDSSKSSGSGLDDSSVVDYSSPRSPFALLSIKEKNEYWWEIAKAATRQRGEDRVFVLDTATANKLARRFNCTPVQVMEFFREGSESDWLGPDPDEEH